MKHVYGMHEATAISVGLGHTEPHLVDKGGKQKSMSHTVINMTALRRPQTGGFMRKQNTAFRFKK